VIVERSPLVIVFSMLSLRLLFALRALATVRGNMAGGASVEGHEKGSRIGLSAEDSLDMFVKLPRA